jgi:hypothetical protein
VVLLYGIPSLAVAAAIVLITVLIIIVITRISTRVLSSRGRDTKISYFSWFSSVIFFVSVFAVWWTSNNAPRFITARGVEPSVMAGTQYVLVLDQPDWYYLIMFMIFIFLILQILGSRTWHSWVVLLFFICSATITVISWQLGIIDAYRGKHIITLDVELPEVDLYSNASISALEGFAWSGNSPDEFVYGPLVLVYSDQSGYYLASTNLKEYVSGGSRVYVVPKTDGILISVKSRGRTDAVIAKPIPLGHSTVTATVSSTSSVTETPSPEP